MISPLYANVFLHYVLDLWIHDWRNRQAKGEVTIVRYADDFVIGFREESDARKCLVALGERFARFGLELHPEKTPGATAGLSSSAFTGHHLASGSGNSVSI